MFQSPYTQVSTKKTPQTEPIPFSKSRQVKNSAGGFVYALTDLQALERFLILGSEGGTYYIGERELTMQNALRTIKTIEAHGEEAVKLIVDISDSGRAPKNDPAIFALALAAAAPDPRTRALALANLPKVCRIPTHLFHFLTFTKQFRGFGRGLKRAVGEWYQGREVKDLAYQVVKYQSRDGWSNADALRLSHPKTSDEERQAVYRWVVDGVEGVATRHRVEVVPAIIRAFEDAKLTNDLVSLIKSQNLSREMLPTESLTKPEVWEALLEHMPPHALLRNLGNLSKCGLLSPLSQASKTVIAKLSDGAALRKKRVHPVDVLIALKVYSRGKGIKGKGEWTPVPAVIDALDDAFYACFSHLEPSGKRMLFAIDMSGSMLGSGWSGGLPDTACGLAPCEAAAAMLMACIKVEKDYYTMGFASEFRDIGVTSKMRLDTVVKHIQSSTFGRTDCAQPMVWALKNRVDADGFVVITDNETYAGSIHPSQALRQYRGERVKDAKEVVMGVTSTGFTIADPNDPGALDVVGFDASVPQVISGFMQG